MDKRLRSELESALATIEGQRGEIRPLIRQGITGNRELVNSGWGRHKGFAAPPLTRASRRAVRHR